MQARRTTTTPRAVSHVKCNTLAAEQIQVSRTGDAGAVRAAIEAAVSAALAECQRADLEAFIRGAGIERGIGWLQRRAFEPYGVRRVGQLTDTAMRAVAAAAFLDPAPVI